ncbi:MAG: DUF4340 domain-containing protein [Pirellulaceae bacterium]
MKETTKTAIFAGVAAVLGLGAWLTAPRTADSGRSPTEGIVGKDLFDKYDPLAASTLKIVKVNEELGKVSDFEVTRDRESGVWTIPSHFGYPADAAAQMSESANTFINLKVLQVVSERRDEHALFGVVEPDLEKLQAGDQGVGLLVRLQDEKGDNLVNLLIGKPVKDKPGQRFVRIPGQDPIYAVEINTDPLSTDFSRWIESDLLKLSSNDIQTIGIRDYSILPSQDGSQVLSPNYDADLSFNTIDGKWTADRIVSYQGGNDTPRIIGESEQLNSTKLNEMKNALDSLKLVDVQRKPKGLASDLKVESSLLDDKESVVALVRKGFVPQKGKDGGSEIYASSGELLVGLRDGVQYLIRFGNSREAQASDQDPAKNDSQESDSLALDRYMLVTAKLDESKFPSPQLQQIPETYEQWLEMEARQKAAAAGPQISAPAEGTPAETPPVPDAPVPQTPESAPVTTEEAATGTEPSAEGGDAPTAADKSASAEQPQPEAPEGTEQPPAPDQPPAKDDGQAAAKRSAIRLVSFQPQEEGKAETPVGQVAPLAANPQDPAAAQEPSVDAPLTDSEKKERLELAREKISKENQRLIDDRNERLEGAKKKVAELNARFADWFYVINDKEYKRLRAQLDELIQPKGAAAPGIDPGAFRPGQFNLPGNP